MNLEKGQKLCNHSLCYIFENSLSLLLPCEDCMLQRTFACLSTLPASASVNKNTPTKSAFTGRLRLEESNCGAHNFGNGPWIVNVNTCQKILDLPKLA